MTSAGAKAARAASSALPRSPKSCNFIYAIKLYTVIEAICRRGFHNPGLAAPDATSSIIQYAAI
jgi:hypothetical protein